MVLYCGYGQLSKNHVTPKWCCGLLDEELLDLQADMGAIKVVRNFTSAAIEHNKRHLWRNLYSVGFYYNNELFLILKLSLAT